MKLTIPIAFDVGKNKEVLMEVDLPDDQLKPLIVSMFKKLDYEGRVQVISLFQKKEVKEVLGTIKHWDG